MHNCYIHSIVAETANDNDITTKVATTTIVVYFDQPWGAAHFQTFFLDFRCDITEKGLKLLKRLKTTQNTQHIMLTTNLLHSHGGLTL